MGKDLFMINILNLYINNYKAGLESVIIARRSDS